MDYGGSPFKNRSGSLNVEAVVDESGAQVEIEYAHDSVHRDIFVTASEYLSPLNISTPRVYLIHPPTGFDVHCVFDIRVSAPCRIQMYGSPVFSDVGTALIHYRHNRGSLIADDARISTYHSPTVSDNGNLLQDIYSGGATNNPNNRIGGQTRSGEEIVLPNGKNLLLVITPDSDGVKLSFENGYYEVK